MAPAVFIMIFLSFHSIHSLHVPVCFLCVFIFLCSSGHYSHYLINFYLKALVSPPLVAKCTNRELYEVFLFFVPLSINYSTVPRPGRSSIITTSSVMPPQTSFVHPQTCLSTFGSSGQLNVLNWSLNIQNNAVALLIPTTVSTK